MRRDFSEKGLTAAAPAGPSLDTTGLGFAETDALREDGGLTTEFSRKAGDAGADLRPTRMGA